MNDSSLFMKAEKLAGDFYNTAMDQNSANWGIVKAHAGEVLKQYCGMLHPSLSSGLLDQ